MRLSVQGKMTDISFFNSLMRIQIRDLSLQPITWQFISLHAEKLEGKPGSKYKELAGEPTGVKKT